jgi:hypothetical protein
MDLEGSDRGLILRYYTSIKETEETHEKPQASDNYFIISLNKPNQLFSIREMGCDFFHIRN